MAVCADLHGSLLCMFILCSLKTGVIMRSYDEIFDIAADRKGGAEALNVLLANDRPTADLTAIPEHRWLAIFAQHLFATGLNWKVIEAKWDGFEAAFDGFDPDSCAMIVEDRLDALVSDTRIVRHGAKIRAVQENAVFIQSLRAEGGIATVIRDWPDTEFHELLAMLKTRGSRLGGSIGAYSLRHLGRSSYILSRDVTGRLIAEGVIEKPATSKGAMKAVQGAFNIWMEQSGRSLTEISRTLAMSCGD